MLEIQHILYAICNGSPNAEIEDCYSKDVYEDVILNEFGVNINVSEFRGNKKWSDRIADCFRAQGKQWNDTMEKRVKLAVANTIPDDVNLALNPHKRSCIDAVVSAIEVLIN